MDYDDELSEPVGELRQATLFPERAEPGNLELYHQDEMFEIAPRDWHMAVLIFREMGWKPSRDLASFLHPLSFVTADDGVAMQRAGRSLFKLAEKDPEISLAVQMDIGLLYLLTEFVGNGAFVVGRPGSYAEAKTGGLHYGK